MSDDAQILANHLITLSIVDYDDVFVKSATELRRLDALVKEQAAEVEALKAQRDELLEALEEARAGLRWYQDRNPGQTDGSDDEAMARIDAAIAKAGGQP